MIYSLLLRPIAGLALLAAASVAPGADIAGIVRDEAGKPLANARVDHIGRIVVVSPTRLAVAPAESEIRTDSEGHFRVTTNVPAVVIRKPGYQSRRVSVNGDAEWDIALKRIASESRCKLSATPAFRTKSANDADYEAKWYYITTKNGRQGILSGSGPMYTWGAPEDRLVWTSIEYNEYMLDDGVVDASGRLADGTYWRSRSIFGAAAKYASQRREIAEQLDCVLDLISVGAQ